MINKNLEDLAKKLNVLGYKTVVFATKEEVNPFILEKCKNKTVGVADAHTIKDLNLVPALQGNTKELFAMQLNKSRENKLNSLLTNVFILSANAVSIETGEIINRDSSGNRVAGSIYGPDEVIFIIGKNKLCKTTAEGLNRIKEYVAPKNSIAHNYKTPCVIDGKCHNCNTPDCICRVTVILHKPPKKTPTTVILVNEDLGW